MNVILVVEDVLKVVVELILLVQWEMHIHKKPHILYQVRKKNKNIRYLEDFN